MPQPAGLDGQKQAAILPHPAHPAKEQVTIPCRILKQYRHPRSVPRHREPLAFMQPPDGL
ncbi:MAG: hypothetical protein ACRDOB_20620 [Streptosporangiaceae bacterium]